MCVCVLANVDKFNRRRIFVVLVQILSTFDLCAQVHMCIYTYIMCASNQKFSSTVDRRPPVCAIIIIHILHVYAHIHDV